MIAKVAHNAQYGAAGYAFVEMSSLASRVLFIGLELLEIQKVTLFLSNRIAPANSLQATGMVLCVKLYAAA